MPISNWLRPNPQPGPIQLPPKPYIFVDAYSGGQRDWVAQFLKGLELRAVTIDDVAPGGRLSAADYVRLINEAAFIIVVITLHDVGVRGSGPATTVRQDSSYIREHIADFKRAVGLDRVWVLHQEGVELPPEVNALPISRPDGPTGWLSLLARQFKAAGIDFPLADNLG